jgi:hypothetical protein
MQQSKAEIMGGWTPLDAQHAEIPPGSPTP